MRVDPGAAAALLAAAALMLGTRGAAAQTPAAAPPADLLAACAACHGAGGVSGVPQFPSLAGQPRMFLETQLVLISEGLRDVPTMAPLMKGMSDETIGALAAYFAAQPPPKPPPGVAPKPELQRAGAAIAERALCGTCHLPDYRGQQQVPRLAGQQEAYLLASMQQLRDAPGPGRDTVMAATLRGMSDADLGALAHYLATFGNSAAAR
jgi:cytochrome c553